MRTIYLLLIGFLVGFLFYHYIWIRKIEPWFSFQIQWARHSWMHFTRRARINRIKKGD